MERLILSDRQGEPIVLIGTNAGMIGQVAHQQAVRAKYRKHPRLHFAYAHVLLVEVEYRGTAMLLDTRHVCIRFFAPQNSAEHEAVADAESHIRRAKLFEDDLDFHRSVVERAAAEEKMWLAVTGCLANVPDKPAVTKNRMFQGTATWNEYEPVDPRLL